MSESLFVLASCAAMAAWAGLVMALLVPPGKLRRALLACSGRGVPAGLCALYAGLLVTHWDAAPNGGFSSLTAVLALFSVPGKMLGGWVHFLAFDLLVGRWMADDALAEDGLSWVLWLTLPTTFLYGPLGWLLYWLARSALRSRERRAAGLR